MTASAAGPQTLLEAARLQANLTARPCPQARTGGDRGPTPQEVWDRRFPITADQRQAFLQCVARTQADVRSELGYAHNTVLNRAARGHRGPRRDSPGAGGARLSSGPEETHYSAL